MSRIKELGSGNGVRRAWMPGLRGHARSSDGLPTLFDRLHQDLDALWEAFDGLRQAGAGEVSEQQRRSGGHAFFEALPDGCVITDHNGAILKSNPAAARMLQTRPPDLLGKPIQDFLAAEAESAGSAFIAEPLETREWMVRLKPARGVALQVKITRFPLRGAAGGPAVLGWSLQKGSVPCRDKDACWYGESQLRLLVESVPNVLWTADREGNIVFVSRGIEPLSGYSPDEMMLMGSRMRERLIHPDDLARVNEAYQALFTGDETFDVEYRIVRKGGDWVWVGDRALATFTANGARYAHGMLTDITERKQAEEQARRHQAELAHVARLNTMGEMASMLAHELNQPLAAIVNYTQGCVRRLRMRAGDSEDLCAVMEEVRGQAERAGEIIRRLRRFVAKGEPRTAEADLNSLVREVVGLADPEARQNGVDIRLDLAEDLAPVLVDAIQIQQVILNLVRNGIDAMSGPGPERRILGVCTALTESGEEIEIAVSDTGIGIPSEIADEIFSPFFTTKAKGMGVGLSFSRALIEAHGGRLIMTSNPDGGVTFRFTLPVDRQGELGTAMPRERD